MSSNLTKQSRQVSGFDRVALHDIGELVITQGDVEALEIEAEEDVLAEISTEVRDGTLHIQIGRDWLERIFLGLFTITRRDITYRLTVRELHGVSTSGAASVQVEQLATDRLELSVSGTGEMEIANLSADTLAVTISGHGEFDLGGKVKEQSIRISGSGDVEASNLMSERATVHVSGSGKVRLQASDSLDIHISGSGQVEYCRQSPGYTVRVGYGPDQAC